MCIRCIDIYISICVYDFQLVNERKKFSFPVKNNRIYCFWLDSPLAYTTMTLSCTYEYTLQKAFTVKRRKTDGDDNNGKEERSLFELIEFHGSILEKE